VKKIKAAAFLLVLTFFVATTLDMASRVNADPFVLDVLSGITGLAVVPGLLGFGWLVFLKDVEEPLSFLSRWNSVSQFVFLALNLVRIEMSSWGIVGLLYAAAYILLISSNAGDYSSYPRRLRRVGMLILFNFLLSFTFILLTLDAMNPVLLAGLGFEGANVYGILLTEMSIMGVLLSAGSQLYWLDILEKKIEVEAWEAYFHALDERERERERERENAEMHAREKI